MSVDHFYALFQSSTKASSHIMGPLLILLSAGYLLLAKKVVFTEEAVKRAARSIRRDLKLMRKLKIVD